MYTTFVLLDCRVLRKLNRNPYIAEKYILWAAISSLTIRVYHSFNCYCTQNMRNVTKFQENLTLQQFKVIQVHRSWCQCNQQTAKQSYIPVSHLHQQCQILQLQSLGVRASSVSPRRSAYTPRACYPYYSMAQRPGPSYKPTGINWIHFMYGANDASCTSDGTTSYLTMKSCIVPACSTSRTSFASEDWVSLGTSPDFDAMYQQTRSYKSAPSRGMVSGLHMSGDAPVADRRPPGPTRFAATRV